MRLAESDFRYDNLHQAGAKGWRPTHRMLGWQVCWVWRGPWLLKLVLVWKYQYKAPIEERMLGATIESKLEKAGALRE